MRVRLTQLDGGIPNLALMKLAHYHLAQGDEVHLARTPTPTMFEDAYDRVYASAIFSWTQPVIERLRLAYPDAIVGGTGSGSAIEAEAVIGSLHRVHRAATAGGTVTTTRMIVCTRVGDDTRAQSR